MSNPLVQFDAPSAYFGTYGFAAMPAGTYQYELKDGVTGVGGDGTFTACFAINELTVYGAGTNGPNIHIVKHTNTNPIGQGYDQRVHRLCVYTVVGAALVGTRDVRVQGGVDNTNINGDALSIAQGNINTGTALNDVAATSPLASTGGLNPTISLASPVPVALGGTGTASPSLVDGTGTHVTGSFPDQAVNNTGVLSVTAATPLTSSGGQNPVISIPDPLPIAHGGTGATSAAIVAGTGITESGTFPNQTINNDGVLTIGDGTHPQKGTVVASSQDGSIKVDSSTAATLKLMVAIPIGTADPSSPIAGQLFYRSDIPALRLYTGTAWVAV